MLVVRALRGVLKLRYLLLGGAIAGGGALQKVVLTTVCLVWLTLLFQKYDDWKDGLPDLKWLDEVLPAKDKWQEWRGSLIDFKDSIKDNIEIGEL